MITRTTTKAACLLLAVAWLPSTMGCSSDADAPEDRGGTAITAGGHAGEGGQDGGGGEGGADDALPAGVYELAGLDADLPHDDFPPLAAMLGDTPVVGLGESVHTSGGYYQAKHRLFRYLVEELDFRSFAFESSWTDADRVADYVRTCQGSAETAVTQGLFSVWASQSVLELVEWMCAYNQAHPDDPVHFWGFDIQQPWDDGPSLMAYLETVAPAEAAAFNADIVRCNGASHASVGEYYADPNAQIVDPQDHEACIAGLDMVDQYLVDREAAVIAASSEEELAWGWIHSVGLRAWEGEMANIGVDEVAAYEARDEGMAYVFQEIWRLRHPDDKVALWAHNWHIAHGLEHTGAYPQGARNMGSLLREALGSDYAAVGLTGYNVSVDWPGVHQGPYDPPVGANHVEVLLHDLGRSHLLVDLTFPGAQMPLLDPAAEYLVNGWSMIPAEQFRALVFLDESPAMDPLLW